MCSGKPLWCEMTLLIGLHPHWQKRSGGSHLLLLMSCGMGPKWRVSHVHVRARGRAGTHEPANVCWRAHTRMLCIIVEESLLPVCVPPHFSSLAVGGPTVWASDELLMAATWHCHVAFSMTVASASVSASVVHTWCVCNEQGKILPLSLTNDTSFSVLSKACCTGSQMWADVGSVTGAAAAVSVMGKTNLGGLVRHQCVKATGADVTWTLFLVDRGRACTPSCVMNGENLPLAYVRTHTQNMACFPSWQRLPGIIHGTHPVSHGACATHVFLFNLLVFSSSATTRTLPAIFFPARYKRITDVKGWNVYSPLPIVPCCD